MSDEVSDLPVKVPSFISRATSRITLEVALGIIIIIACLIVAVGYLAYLNNPNRKYDIARPGENEAQNLRVPDEYEESGPVDIESIDKKIEYLNEEIKALNSVNEFNPEDINDQAIGLSNEASTN